MEIKYFGMTRHTNRTAQGHTYISGVRIASLDKDHWPLNSLDLNLLDYYCIWDELGQQMNWDKIQ